MKRFCYICLILILLCSCVSIEDINTLDDLRDISGSSWAEENYEELSNKFIDIIESSIEYLNSTEIAALCVEYSDVLNDMPESSIALIVDAYYDQVIPDCLDNRLPIPVLSGIQQSYHWESIIKDKAKDYFNDLLLDNATVENLLGVYQHIQSQNISLTKKEKQDALDYFQDIVFKSLLTGGNVDNIQSLIDSLWGMEFYIPFLEEVQKVPQLYANRIAVLHEAGALGQSLSNYINESSEEIFNSYDKCLNFYENLIREGAPMEIIDYNELLLKSKVEHELNRMPLNATRELFNDWEYDDFSNTKEWLMNQNIDELFRIDLDIPEKILENNTSLNSIIEKRDMFKEFLISYQNIEKDFSLDSEYVRDLSKQAYGMCDTWVGSSYVQRKAIEFIDSRLNSIDEWKNSYGYKRIMQLPEKYLDANILIQKRPCDYSERSLQELIDSGALVDAQMSLRQLFNSYLYKDVDFDVFIPGIWRNVDYDLGIVAYIEVGRLDDKVSLGFNYDATNEQIILEKAESNKTTKTSTVFFNFLDLPKILADQEEIDKMLAKFLGN